MNRFNCIADRLPFNENNNFELKSKIRFLFSSFFVIALHWDTHLNETRKIIHLKSFLKFPFTRDKETHVTLMRHLNAVPWRAFAAGLSIVWCCFMVVFSFLNISCAECIWLQKIRNEYLPKALWATNQTIDHLDL